MFGKKGWKLGTNSSQDSLYLGQDSNWVPYEYKSGKLPPRSTSVVLLLAILHSNAVAFFLLWNCSRYLSCRVQHCAQNKFRSRTLQSLGVRWWHTHTQRAGTAGNISSTNANITKQRDTLYHCRYNRMMIIMGLMMGCCGDHSAYSGYLQRRTFFPLVQRLLNSHKGTLMHEITCRGSSNNLLSWALPEKLQIVQPLKNFPAFYGTRRFIAVFTRAPHWVPILSQMDPFHTIPFYLSLSVLILSTHLRLGLPSDVLPSGFPTDILFFSVAQQPPYWVSKSIYTHTVGLLGWVISSSQDLYLRKTTQT
jgi:hypothetical protein